MKIPAVLASVLAAFVPPGAAEESLRGRDRARDGEAGAVRAARADDRPAPGARELQWTHVREGYCGDIELPLAQSAPFEYCGWCRDENNDIFQGIAFVDVGDSQACLARCPPSNKFVGYEYALYFGGTSNFCGCRYEAEYVRPNNKPTGSFYYGGVGAGPVTQGNGELHVACRTQPADDDVLAWVKTNVWRMADDDSEDGFDAWSNYILDGNQELGVVVNPQALVDYAAGFRPRNNAGSSAGLRNYQDYMSGYNGGGR